MEAIIEMKNVVYDKVSWHYPEGEKCPTFEAAKAHFEVLMEWLNQHELLSPYGKEVWAFGIEPDFGLTSDMLTEQGNVIIGNHYQDWLKTLEYGEAPSTSLLDNYFEKK